MSAVGESDHQTQSSGVVMPGGLRVGRSPDLDWYFDHLDELIAEYPGEFVGIWKQRVLAHAKTAEQLAETLRKTYKGIPALFVRCSWEGWEPYK
jgi:hypothetical protein